MQHTAYYADFTNASHPPPPNRGGGGGSGSRRHSLGTNRTAFRRASTTQSYSARTVLKVEDDHNRRLRQLRRYCQSTTERERELEWTARARSSARPKLCSHRTPLITAAHQTGVGSAACDATIAAWLPSRRRSASAGGPRGIRCSDRTDGEY